MGYGPTWKMFYLNVARLVISFCETSLLSLAQKGRKALNSAIEKRRMSNSDKQKMFFQEGLIFLDIHWTGAGRLDSHWTRLDSNYFMNFAHFGYRSLHFAN